MLNVFMFDTLVMISVRKVINLHRNEITQKKYCLRKSSDLIMS